MGILMSNSNYALFVFICSQIWKGRKWIRRSKIMSVVNLNMVYQVPVWKQENIYLGSKNMYFKHVHLNHLIA